MTEDRTLRPPPNLSSYPRVRLLVSSGPDSGLNLEFSSATVRVGSSSESDLVLSDPGVVARHCCLEVVAGGVRVRDEGSGATVLLGKVRVFDAIAELPFELALGQSRLSFEALADSERREHAGAERFGDLVGSSLRMRELFAQLALVAGGEGSVLIEGERGSGRELVAESIHDASRRASGAFVVFDCQEPPLPELGRELDTADEADSAPARALERAVGGSLYLHEVGFLPHEMQEALVGLVASEAARAGSARARLIASSSKNLSAEVKRGNFCADLLQTLDAARVRIPPLRDRSEDLSLLVGQFLARAHPAFDPATLPRSLWNALAEYHWPGNVSELWSTLQALTTAHEPRVAERAAARAEGLGDAGAGSELVPLRVARRAAAEQFERNYLAGLLARTQGNVTRAAAIAEVSRQMVQKLLRKHKVG